MDLLRLSPLLGQAIRPGKQALKGEHRSLVIESGTDKVAESLDFEGALGDRDLDCKRFDYFISTTSTPGECHALEVHAFHPSELASKKAGTLKILQRHTATAAPAVASWHVLVKGAMPRADLAARLRAECRIRVAGRSLVISRLTS